MRFADVTSRLVVAAACALVAGCATQKADPGPAVATAAAAPPPVDPAAQSAFDDARRALAAGQVEQAERGFRTLTQTHPDLGGPHADLGLIYRQSGKLPEAVAALEAAVKASPQQPVYLNQLGLAYRQQGRFDKAREAYEQALRIDPDYAAATLNLGILNDLYLGDGRRALELYERYLVLSPGGDATVSKWIVDLNNRKPQRVASGQKDKS
jgi:tetratricopeptide (TPR) repeat protein